MEFRSHYGHRFSCFPLAARSLSRQSSQLRLPDAKGMASGTRLAMRLDHGKAPGPDLRTWEITDLKPAVADAKASVVMAWRSRLVKVCAILTPLWGC